MPKLWPIKRELNENKNSATCYRHGAKKQEMQNVDQAKLTRDYDSVIQ